MSIILACNAGSTNSKFAAFDRQTGERKAHATIHNNMAEIIEWLCSVGSLDISAIGHRVVHGGREFTQPVVLDDTIVAKIAKLAPLAPLHQPAALRLIEETRKLYPKLPHIACFDTAFHHTQPAIEQRLPIPHWFHKEGIQRYGFHGLSYQHIANVLPDYLGEKVDGRVIVAHLGGGSSACAMLGRKSVASTMGFSTLDGMMMGTRCGSIDAGVIFYLMEQLEMKEEEVRRMLYLESGLLGVSGLSGDMRDVMASDQPRAKEAVALYCHLAAKQIASLLPAIGGMDALIFTGGIGEHAASVRENITAALKWAGDFAVHVIPTNEEKVIADECLRLA